jgi:hypothetical protein
LLNYLTKIDQIRPGTLVDATCGTDNGFKGGKEMGKHTRDDLVTLGEDWPVWDRIFTVNPLVLIGTIEGRRATTHPAYSELLEKLGVTYVEGYSVEDGRFLTMAGVSGGIDTTLELVAKLTSEGAAKRIQTMIEYDPQPPFGAIDWSEVDGDGLPQTLHEHRAGLEQALASRPDLYQKLFG